MHGIRLHSAACSVQQQAALGALLTWLVMVCLHPAGAIPPSSVPVILREYQAEPV